MNRLTIDDLEMLNPFELGELLIAEALKKSPDSTDVQYIKDLLAVGCPIDARDGGDYYSWTPLQCAAYNCKLEMVKFLLSKGADVNARGYQGWTALHRAAKLRRLEIAEFLISNGAQVNLATYKGIFTPLTLGSPNLEIIRLLVNNGADVNAREYNGCGALHKAATYSGNIETVEFLLSVGADVDIKDISGKTPWDYATNEIRKAIPELEPK